MKLFFTPAAVVALVACGTAAAGSTNKTVSLDRELEPAEIVAATSNYVPAIVATNDVPVCYSASDLQKGRDEKGLDYERFMAGESAGDFSGLMRRRIRRSTTRTGQGRENKGWLSAIEPEANEKPSLFGGKRPEEDAIMYRRERERMDALSGTRGSPAGSRRFTERADE